MAASSAEQQPVPDWLENGYREEQEFLAENEAEHNADPTHATADARQASGAGQPLRNWAPRVGNAEPDEDASRIYLPHSAEAHENGSAPLHSVVDGEVPLVLTPVLTKLGPKCADPSSMYACAEHFRSCMMLERDPFDRRGAAGERKHYTVPTPLTESSPFKYDGLAHCIMRRIYNLVHEANDPDDVLSDVKAGVAQFGLANTEEEADEDVDWSGIFIGVHVPMQRLLPETDDRCFRVPNPTYAVNEQLVLKRGRYSWTAATERYRLLNTSLNVAIGDTTLVFKYVGNYRPFIEVYDLSGAASRTPRWSIPDMNPTSTFGEEALPSHPFRSLVDFEGYGEREIAECAPSDFVSVSTYELLALAARKSDQDRSIAAILRRMGRRVRFDCVDSSWWSWSPSMGWSSAVKDDTAVRTAIRAAATDAERVLQDVAMLHEDHFQEVWSHSMAWAGIPDDGGASEGEEERANDGDDGEKSPCGMVRSLRLTPKSDRAMTSYISNLQPWVTEAGFSKTFETCRDVAFRNGVQEMRAPFGFHPETPADRVTTRISCDLPAPVQSAEEADELQAFAIAPLLDIFMREDVAKREADKLACLLTGTCAVMPEANVRIQIGPYNRATEQFAGRVGKDTIGNHMKALLGNAMSTDWGLSMLSSHFDPTKNNPGFEGLDKHIAHWITDGSATREGTDTLRRWGDVVKKIWAGGSPSHFPVMLKNKNKVPLLPRSNGVYVSSQRYNIGTDDAIWSRLEVSPYPRVGNIPENAQLVEEGVPTFEIDPNYIQAATNMSELDRGRHLRYLVDRAVAISDDPKAAYPVTDAHIAPKRLLREVAGGIKDTGAGFGEIDAMDELGNLLDEVLSECEPPASDLATHAGVELTTRRRMFQAKAPRCFCNKPGTEACHFTVSNVAEALRVRYPNAYSYFVQHSTRLAKLAAAIQKLLGLEDTGGQLSRKGKFPRDAVFGWTVEDPNKRARVA
jgi:hypothetical protein